MATRRSRLQIKPNLGPKGVTKPQGPTTKSSTPVDTTVKIDSNKSVENSAKLESVGIEVTAKIPEEMPKQLTNIVSDNETAQKVNDNSSESKVVGDNNKAGSTTEPSNIECTKTEPVFTLSKNQDKLSTSKTSSDDTTEEKTVELPAKKLPSIRNRLPKAKPNIPSRSGSVRLQSNSSTNDIRQQESRHMLDNSSEIEKKTDDSSKNQQKSLNTERETNKDQPAPNKDTEIQNISVKSDLLGDSKGSQENTQKDQQKAMGNVPEIVVQPPAVEQVQPLMASMNVTSTPEKRPTEVTSSPLKPLLIRNRLPKAKPNLTDLTRNRRLTPTSQGFQQSPLKSPLKSPMKLVRPSASPLKAVKDLSMLDNVTEPPETSSKEVNVTAPPAVITLPSAQDKHPLVEQQQAEKRNRTMSISEAATVKPRIKRPKVIPSADAPADRTKMKMAELIYWNPSRNPMKQKNNEPKPSTPLKSLPMTKTRDDNSDDDMDEENLDKEMDKSEDMPAPQVKIGPNGEIILNEASLVIENKAPTIEEDSSIIDETDSFVTYGSFREKRTRAFWSEKETEKFFKALSYIGTDFSLMKKVFPQRTRVELKF
ncbi:hypothetical protein KUTeg_023365 [Tegillarca granosa]|uniref:Transcription factor TFIIIB component B'' Myb domain-containing protein n=1 Tax=Tegillarca granosa TaxID=220873 RepID=A0ABQ9E750_TEGGR|nr:hypothetical protein KUTeg_023365 [Tegillarca granosa]